MIVDYTLAIDNMGFNFFRPIFFLGPNVILSLKGLENFFIFVTIFFLKWSFNHFLKFFIPL
jgi:hypothetical protein